jgi:hypothetical protein
MFLSVTPSSFHFRASDGAFEIKGRASAKSHPVHAGENFVTPKEI